MSANEISTSLSLVISQFLLSECHRPTRPGTIGVNNQMCVPCYSLVEYSGLPTSVKSPENDILNYWSVAK